MQKAVGGGCLGARDIGGMSAYEAKSHRRQNCQNFQNTLNRSRMRNCTTNFIGSTALPTVIDTVSGSLMPTKRGSKLYKILRAKTGGVVIVAIHLLTKPYLPSRSS